MVAGVLVVTTGIPRVLPASERVYSAGRGRGAGAETNELVLEEVAEDGEAAHASDAARLEAALLELVVQLGPVVHPDRTSFQSEGDSEGTVDVA